MTTAIAPPSALPDLADAINLEHKAAIEHAQHAVEHALKCGRLLIQAKGQLPHGEFLSWLSEHCHVKQRQARNYMRVADNWQAIEAKTAPGADLTIKGALAVLQAEERDQDAEDTRTALQRKNAAVIESLREEIALGKILRWGDAHGKPKHSLGWLRDLSHKEFDDLLAALGPICIDALDQMMDRATRNFGLSMTVFPDTLFIALARNNKTSVAADLASDLQAKLDAIGLDGETIEKIDFEAFAAITTNHT